MPCGLEQSCISVETEQVKLSFVSNDACETADTEPGADRHR